MSRVHSALILLPRFLTEVLEAHLYLSEHISTPLYLQITLRKRAEDLPWISYSDLETITRTRARKPRDENGVRFTKAKREEEGNQPIQVDRARVVGMYSFASVLASGISCLYICIDPSRDQTPRSRKTRLILTCWSKQTNLVQRLLPVE